MDEFEGMCQFCNHKRGKSSCRRCHDLCCYTCLDVASGYCPDCIDLIRDQMEQDANRD